MYFLVWLTGFLCFPAFVLLMWFGPWRRIKRFIVTLFVASRPYLRDALTVLRKRLNSQT